MGNAHALPELVHAHDLGEFLKWEIIDVDKAYKRFTYAKDGANKHGDLSMTRSEFWEAFTDYDTIVSGEFLTLPIEQYSLFDPEGANKVYALEVFVVLVLFCNATTEEKLSRCFQFFDFDHSTTISRVEMVMLTRVVSRGLNRIGSIDVVADYDALEALAQTTFEELDKNHDNELTIEEFLVWAQENGSATMLLSKLITRSRDNASDVKGGASGVSIKGKRSLRGNRPLQSKKSEKAGKGHHRNRNEINEVVLKAETRMAMDRRKMISTVCSRKIVRSLALITGLPLSGVSELASEFGKYAWENKGKLSERHFMKIMTVRFPELEKALMKRLFDSYDVDNSGFIEFQEFVLGLSNLLSGTVNEKLRLLFDVLDLDGSGTIDIQEFLKALEYASDQLRAEAQFTLQIMHSLDLDFDGEIGKGEFVKVILGSKPLLTAISRHLPRDMNSTLSVLRLETDNSNIDLEHMRQYWVQKRKEPRWSSSNDHVVYRGEFRKMIRDAFSCSEKAVEFLLSVFDKIGATKIKQEGDETKIEVRELFNGVSQIMDVSTEEKVIFYFDLYDYDGSGTIDPIELVRMIVEAHSGIDNDRSTLIELVQKFDADSSHSLDRNEFVETIKDNPEYLKLFGHIFEATHVTVEFTPEESPKPIGPNQRRLIADYKKLQKKINK